MTSSLCLAHPPSGYGVDYRAMMHVGGYRGQILHAVLAPPPTLLEAYGLFSQETPRLKFKSQTGEN